VETRDGWCDVLIRIGDREIRAVASCIARTHPIRDFLCQLAAIDEIVQDNRPFCSAFDVGMSVAFCAEPGGHQFFCDVRAAATGYAETVRMQMFEISGEDRPFRDRASDFDYPSALSGHVAYEDFKAEIMRNAREILRCYGLTGLRMAWLAMDWESQPDDVFPLEAYLRLLDQMDLYPRDIEGIPPTAQLLRDLHGLHESLRPLERPARI